MLNCSRKVCVKMLSSFRAAYEETQILLKQNKKEIAWDFSPTYVFGLADMFLARLEKVNVIDIGLRVAPNEFIVYFQDPNGNTNDREILDIGQSVH